LSQVTFSQWSSQTSGVTSALYSVYFFDAQTGWAAGGNFSPNLGMVHHTTDGGANWTVQTGRHKIAGLIHILAQYILPMQIMAGQLEPQAPFFIQAMEE